jgi:hypothetical protein
MSEMRMSKENWVPLVPFVQHSINNTPSRRAKELSPVEVFLGLERDDLLKVVLNQAEMELQDVPVEEGVLKETVEELHKVLDANGKIAGEERVKLREQAKLYQELKAKEVDFDVGDLVLVSTIKEPNVMVDKKMVNWLGPYRVVEFIHENIYSVEHLVYEKRERVHACRLLRYKDSKFEVTEEMKRQVMFHETGYIVEAIRDHGKSENGRCFLEISWLGFEEGYNTKEPAITICKQVPEMVKEYLSAVTTRRDRDRLTIAKALERYDTRV